MTKFTIPLWRNPPSHQHGIGIRVGRNGSAMTYKKSDLAAFQQQFAMLMRMEINKTKFRRIMADYGVSCTFYLINRKHPDVTNMWKTIEDACEGQLYDNDKFAKEIFLYREYDKLNPRIEIEITEFNL